VLAAPAQPRLRASSTSITGAESVATQVAERPASPFMRDASACNRWRSTCDSRGRGVDRNDGLARRRDAALSRSTSLATHCGDVVHPHRDHPPRAGTGASQSRRIAACRCMYCIAPWRPSASQASSRSAAPATSRSAMPTPRSRVQHPTRGCAPPAPPSRARRACIPAESTSMLDDSSGIARGPCRFARLAGRRGHLGVRAALGHAIQRRLDDVRAHGLQLNLAATSARARPPWCAPCSGARVSGP